MTLVVLDPGMFTTVQDLGRMGYGALGISAAGAADSISLRIGNRLVGNPDGAAALEMTLRGGIFRLEEAAVVAVCGSDFSASVPGWTAAALAAGDIVTIAATRSGARCTMCVRGGFAVPPVLGSSATHLRSGLGGFGGRALAKGDRIPIGIAPRAPLRRLRIAPSVIGSLIFKRVIRVTDGPQSDWFTAAARGAFLEDPWTVTEQADRMGIRLRGSAVVRERAESLRTEGVSAGAIQITDGGDPIVLFVDQQTTGGYPKPFNVITADFSALGQLRPRDTVRFERVTLLAARAALADQERLLDDAVEDAA